MPPTPSLKKSPRFPYKVAIIQRLLAIYRVPFFEQLAGACKTLTVCAGNPSAWESIRVAENLQKAKRHPVKNRHFFQGKFYFCWQQGLLTWLKQCQPDILVMEANPRLLSNYIAVWHMKAAKRPIVGWGLGILDWEAPQWLLLLRRWVLRVYYQQFDVLIAYSSKGAQDFQKLGIAPKKIFIAPNAVAGTQTKAKLKQILQHPEWITRWKEQWGLSEKPIVLFVGRLIPQKEISNLLKACVAFKDACQIVIIGDGPDRNSLETLAKNFSIHAHFLGHQSGMPLSLGFVASDLFVLPSLGGLAIQEAMGYGKPVVVALGDGTQADLVEEGKNGFLVPPNNVEALSQTIEKCLQNREKLEQMGQESLRIIRERANLETMEEAFLQAMEHALEQVK